MGDAPSHYPRCPQGTCDPVLCPLPFGWAWVVGLVQLTDHNSNMFNLPNSHCDENKDADKYPLKAVTSSLACEMDSC